MDALTSYLCSWCILGCSFCSHSDGHRPCSECTGWNLKLVGPLGFESLPGMFSVYSEVRENALFDIENPGKNVLSGCYT